MTDGEKGPTMYCNGQTTAFNGKACREAAGSKATAADTPPLPHYQSHLPSAAAAGQLDLRIKQQQDNYGAKAKDWMK